MTDLTTAAAEHLSQGVDGSEEFVQHVASWNEAIDSANLAGLLPAAVAMLILHEMYYATSENRAPRVGWMLIRVVGFGACLAGYDRIVGMLTGLVGGGEWPDPGDLIAPLDYALGAQLQSLDHISFSNFGEVGMQFLVWAILFAIDCMMGMLAFVIVTVIMKGQALALIIFIGAGKTCLILSIMPGVGIAKSWAKVVATVAAWSFMAKIVFSAVGIVNPALGHYAASTAIQGHMQIWLTYGVLAIFTAMIPKLVSSLVSGGMSAAPGLGMAVAGGIMGAKFLSPNMPGFRGRSHRARENGSEFAAKSTARSGGKVPRGPSGKPGEAPHGSSTPMSDAPHKVPRGYGQIARKSSSDVTSNGRTSARLEGDNHQGGGRQSASRQGKKAVRRAFGATGKTTQTPSLSRSNAQQTQPQKSQAQTKRSTASSGSRNIHSSDGNHRKTKSASGGSQSPGSGRSAGAGGAQRVQHSSQKSGGTSTEARISSTSFNASKSAPVPNNGQRSQNNSHKSISNARNNYGDDQDTSPPSRRTSRRISKQER